MTFNLRYADYDSSLPPLLAAATARRRRPAQAGVASTSSAPRRGCTANCGTSTRTCQQSGKRYDWIGMGREGGSRGEFMALFYDAARLIPLEYEHFWISENPHVVGDKWPDAGSPRMVTWVRFQEARHGRSSTRSTPISTTRAGGPSRRCPAARSADARSEAPLPPFDSGLPCVLMGDFNVPAVMEKGGVYETLLDGRRVGRFLDGRAAGRARRGVPHVARLQGAGAARFAHRLDPHLARRTYDSTEINTFTLDGEYPSDHFPVQATLRLEGSRGLIAAGCLLQRAPPLPRAPTRGRGGATRRRLSRVARRCE